jgi:ribose transport system substrate-binding protein
MFNKCAFGIAIVLLILAGCGGVNNGSVLVILKTMDNPFFLDIESGVRNSLDECSGRAQFPIIVRAGNSEGDVLTQRSLLEQYYYEYVEGSKGSLSGLVITPSSSGGDMVGMIGLYNHMGIPVILIDTYIQQDALEAEGAFYNVYIGSSNYDGGLMAAQLVKEAVGGRYENKIVLVMNGVDGQETASERRRGFIEGLAGEGDDVAIWERTCNWRRAEAMTTVEALLGRITIAAVFAANDEMALGVIEALKQAGIPDVPVVGYDGIDEAKTAVDAGEMYATIMQDPYKMGAEAARILCAGRLSEYHNYDINVEVKAYVRR